MRLAGSKVGTDVDETTIWSIEFREFFVNFTCDRESIHVIDEVNKAEDRYGRDL